ncbi:MAG: ArgE/DapE family deacylase [Thermomicrobiales bacterium]|nr:ArgE/DapE family deacylase [Thermomicrobiales bacterium]
MRDPRSYLQDRLRSSRDEIIELVQHMVQIPSENPPGDTTELYAYVAGYLEERGLSVETVAPQAHLPNLVASYTGANPGKHLVLNGHLDVFPAGDHASWSDDPFSGLVRDGKMFGRGVSDMKVGTAASILTYIYLAEVRDHLKGTLTLTAVSDEETGGKWGSQYLVDNRPDVLGDCLLNGEPSTPGMVRFGEKGPLWLAMSVSSHGGHGAYTHQSSNAIIKAADIIADLKHLTGLPISIPPAVDAKIEAARAGFDAHLGEGATDTVKQVTLNIGMISGGVKMNVIAADCRVEVDLRCPVGLSSSELLAAFEDVIRNYEGVQYEIVQQTEPSWSDPDHEMVGILLNNAEAIRGIRPNPGISIGATDCRLWREKGIPAFVYGPTPYNMGAPDEFVTLDDLLGTVHVHILSAFDYLTS